ncbi:malto-oligosyltrehalose synthase [Tessaracoccus terricola]
MSTHPVPTSTYRFQLHAGFTFDDAVAQLDHLAALGITHVFCSPILQAAPGSMHGYDVVDHSRISDELGGEAAFRRFAEAARALGLGIVVDVVPNHMAVPTPLFHNHELWEVLRRGSDSPFARWFDVDLTGQQAILMPVLGNRIGQELEAGTITVEERPVPTPDGGSVVEPVVVHYDHVFPVRPGTEDLPLPELLEAQWYRLAHWKVGSEELNYRRFFDVDTLAAVRVEDESVFEASHRLLADLHSEGLIDGFRIDHPDGLANPRQYFADLQGLTGGCWVVVEKILEADETLPTGFECDGTTGYDALLRICGLFQDAAGLPRLNALWERVSGSSEWFGSVLTQAKQEVVRSILFAEVNRLTSIAVAICDGDIRLRDHTRRQLRNAIRRLLVEMDRYRAYVEPGQPAAEAEREVVAEAADRARATLAPDELDTLDLVVALACGDPGTGDEGRGAETLPEPGHGPVTTELPDESPDVLELRAEFMVRFAQTCGPVMAKSKEDTAFYRWNRFIGVNEVGSEPTMVGITPDGFHDFCSTLTEQWPATMTTLSTHDTKRSADVRARLSTLTEYPKEWESCVTELRAATEEQRAEPLDGATEMFVWQTLAGTWRLPGSAAGTAPISEERLRDYLTKALREAKSHTTWTEPNTAYEDTVIGLALHALSDDACAAALDAFTEAVAPSVRANVLGQALLQLTMPGVPDVYQGCELVDLSLVDPDNRRAVDYALRRDLLAALKADPAAPSTADRVGRPAPVSRSLDTEKLLVTTRALRLRAEHPDAFRGAGAEYRPVATTSGHAVAFARAEAGAERVTAITVATRLPSQLGEQGWAEHAIILPEGRFRDVLSGREVEGGQALLADVLTDLPVALLVPADS